MISEYYNILSYTLLRIVRVFSLLFNIHVKNIHSMMSYISVLCHKHAYILRTHIHKNLFTELNEPKTFYSILKCL